MTCATVRTGNAAHLETRRVADEFEGLLLGYTVDAALGADLRDRATAWGRRTRDGIAVYRSRGHDADTPHTCREPSRCQQHRKGICPHVLPTRSFRRVHRSRHRSHPAAGHSARPGHGAGFRGLPGNRPDHRRRVRPVPMEHGPPGQRPRRAFPPDDLRIVLRAGGHRPAATTAAVGSTPSPATSSTFRSAASTPSRTSQEHPRRCCCCSHRVRHGRPTSRRSPRWQRPVGS